MPTAIHHSTTHLLIDASQQQQQQQHCRYQPTALSLRLSSPAVPSPLSPPLSLYPSLFLSVSSSLSLITLMAQSPFVLERAETLWHVTKLTENLVDPKVDPRVELHQFFPDVAFVYTFANVIVVNTDEGLVLIDCCHEYFARPLRRCAQCVCVCVCVCARTRVLQRWTRARAYCNRAMNMRMNAGRACGPSLSHVWTLLARLVRAVECPPALPLSEPRSLTRVLYPRSLSRVLTHVLLCALLRTFSHPPAFARVD